MSTTVILAQVNENGERPLPNGWRRTKLGDVCTIIMGQSPPGDSYNRNSEGQPLLNGPTEFGETHPTAVQWTTSPTKLCESGDILLCVRGATTGRKNVADQPYCLGRGVAAIRAHRHRAVTEFVWFAIEFATQAILRETAGSIFPNLPGEKLKASLILLPPLEQQKALANELRQQINAITRARAAAEAQLEAVRHLRNAFLRESLATHVRRMRLKDCLNEIASGVGESWSEYRVLGATRRGLALAKEAVGKKPERYKLVEPGTVFYNPMRILLGSIAMVDDGEEAGITSPDYVVFTAKPGVLHHRWFYHWLRSPMGDAFIKTLVRGAVRERMLFRRLAGAEVEIPEWDSQISCAARLKQLNSLYSTVSQQIEMINRVPAALLRRAFNGEL